jgi:hypothetical protein
MSPLEKALNEKALDESLTELADAAQCARDCYMMGDDVEGRKAFDRALSAICKAVSQISLKNRK